MTRDTKSYTQYFVYLAAFASGICALSYEVIWFRLLANICGSSVLAASSVAAVFLTGLAIGSVWLGRLSDRMIFPLRVFALLELGIGLCGLSAPFLLSRTETLLASSQLPDFSIFIISVLVLLPPTILMGGTLPVLSKCIALPDDTDVLSRLYAINTGGAALGIGLCAFLLLPQLGQFYSTAVAATLNGLIAVSSFVLAKKTIPTIKSNESALYQLKYGARALALVATGLTGGCSLALEILWSRLFPLYIGNTTYAFALVLCCFLVGLSLGSALYRRFLFNRCHDWQIILILLTLFGIGTVLTLTAFDSLSFIFYTIELAASHNWLLLTSLRFLIIAAVVLPSTIASGALLPALSRMAEPAAPMRGQSLGLLLGINTTGCVIGSLAVPLSIIPLFGLQGSFRCVLFLLAGLAISIILVSRLTRPWQFSVPAILFLIAVVPIQWDQYLVNSGVYVYASEIKHSGGLKADRDKWRMLFHSEGVDATVAVFQEKATGVRSFIVNGKVDGGTADMPTQVLLGQIPMLLHSSPQKTLVIGLGTGITLAETLKYPNNLTTCYEISHGVIAAAAYFAEVNDNVLAQPRATIKQKDARRELLLDKSRFDVIISEPSNPWQSGNSRLFTRDFYRTARQRLNPGGLFCQWLPIYDLPPHLLSTAIATFTEQFPSTVSFLVNGTDLLLVGSPTLDLVVDLPQIVSRWQLPGIEATFRDIGFTDPFAFLAQTFVGGPEFLTAVTHNAPVNSDDNNRLEFFRFHRDQNKKENLRLLVNTMERLDPTLRFAPLAFGQTQLSSTLQAELAQRFRLSGNNRDAEEILTLPR